MSDISSVTGSAYAEMEQRSQMVALDPAFPNLRTRVVPIVHVRNDYTPRIEREAVDAFIRDELTGLLLKTLPLCGYDSGNWREDADRMSKALAEKIKEEVEQRG